MFLQLIPHNLATIAVVADASDNIWIFWTALVGHNGEFCTQQFKSLQCIDASIWNVSKIYFATKYVGEFTILYFAPHRAQSFPKKERWFSLQSFSKVLWLVWSSASLPLWANSYFFLYEMIKHIFFPLANPPAKVLPYLLGELLLLLGREFNVV